MQILKHRKHLRDQAMRTHDDANDARNVMRTHITQYICERYEECDGDDV